MRRKVEPAFLLSASIQDPATTNYADITDDPIQFSFYLVVSRKNRYELASKAGSVYTLQVRERKKNESPRESHGRAEKPPWVPPNL
jgi:hypothetical protein